MKVASTRLSDREHENLVEFSNNAGLITSMYIRKCIEQGFTEDSDNEASRNKEATVPQAEEKDSLNDLVQRLLNGAKQSNQEKQISITTLSLRS